MKRTAVLFLTAFCITACAAFVEHEAVFVGYNISSDRVVVLVNDGQGWEIPPNGSIKFIVRVSIPKNPEPIGGYGGATGPSTVDKVVQLSVAFRNLRTGKLSPPMFCNAGAKVVTTVWYQVSGDNENTRCN